MRLSALLGDLDERAWMLQAQCRGVSPYLFYPDPLLPVERRRVWEREAKSICVHCVVRDECLEWALLYETNGVWGGKTETERRSIKKRRRRAS